MFFAKLYKINYKVHYSGVVFRLAGLNLDPILIKSGKALAAMGFLQPRGKIFHYTLTKGVSPQSEVYLGWWRLMPCLERHYVRSAHR